MANHSILVINPGSTSDLVAFYKGGKQVFLKTVRYSRESMRPFDKLPISAQFEMRKETVLNSLKENGIDLKNVECIIGRGGLLKPIEGGVYAINDRIIEDSTVGVQGEHPCNLGALLAKNLAEVNGVPSFIADPGIVDELDPLARYSGMPENPRISLFHALNQKRVARMEAEKMGKTYEQCRFVIMHAGGGISIGAHRDGRAVDVNGALSGDGPFTPQRSGSVPEFGLVKMCFSGKYTLNEMRQKITGHGGLMAYTGTSDCKALEDYALHGTVNEGSGIFPEKISREKVLEILNAMIYQMAKEIGAYSAVLEGKIDAIILTGGLMYSKYIVKELTRRIDWIAPVKLYPGGDEMAALAESAERALNNPEIIKEYK